MLNYILIAVVALLLIAMPIMMNARNKKETQKVQEQTNNLKVGDKVLTTSGVYGTITEIKFDESKKAVVIETGGKTKSYLTVDAYAIYTVFKSEEELRAEAEARAEAERQRLAEEEAKKLEKKGKKGVEKEASEISAETEKAQDTSAKEPENKENNENKE